MRLEKLDIYFWAFLIVAGFIMYYVYIVVNPTFEILEKQDRLLNLTIEQNKEIINNTNRNADIITAYINKSIANQDENLLYLATILNQSNVIGNQTADLILQSITDIRLLEENITTKNDIQRSQIVLDLSTALLDISERLDGLVAQHGNITASQQEIQNQAGQISGFLGGPLIKNNTIPLNFGLLNRSNITESDNRIIP